MPLCLGEITYTGRAGRFVAAGFDAVAFDERSDDPETVVKNLEDAVNDVRIMEGFYSPSQITEGCVSTTNAATISRTEFAELKGGLTYAQVVEIVGSPGRLQSQTNVSGVDMSTYTWSGAKSGTSGEATFANGVLDSKSDIGLLPDK